MKPFHDPTLPGLGTALDLERLLELLRRELPECGDGLELSGGHIVDVRYQPDGPCWILYRLKVRPGGARSCPQLFSAQVLRDGEEPEPLPRGLVERFQGSRGAVLKTPVVYLPEARMAVYPFPVDAALPRLADALDPKVMRKHLSRLWSRRGVRVAGVEAKPLGYTPQARAAFLYEVLCESREEGVPELRRLIGKMHARKSAARLFAGSWALWRAAGARVNLAPPVGYLGSIGLTLQERVQGERLGGLATVGGFVKRVRQTARMLAALHGLSLPLSTRRKPEDEAGVVRRWAGVLVSLRPDLRERVERLRDRLTVELTGRTRVSGPVHGDFHHTNVLVQEHGVAIIDFDEMAYGDPMLDVGRFLASLRIPSMRAFGSVAALAGARETFLAEYLKRGRGDERRVRLFEAASLVTAAASSFRIQRPNWQEEIEILLAEAERALDAVAGGPVSAPAPPAAPSAGDPRRWALDGTYMQAVLDPHVEKAYGARLEACRAALGGRSERGERIRYQLRGRRGGEKWAASVQGVPWREHGGRGVLRRLEALRAAAGEAPPLPLLPRPLAYLRPLSLVVWEAPGGVRFSSLLGTADGLAAAERVGRALSALHGVSVSLDSARSLEEDLRALGRRVEKLSALRPDLAERARGLLGEVEARCRAALGRRGPTLRTVHPHHVLLGERVALARVEEVALSHPLLDAGDFLARLALLGLQKGRAGEADRAAARFRESYRAAAGFAGDGMAAFEAACLLRLACAQTKVDAPARAAERLLDRAEASVRS